MIIEKDETGKPIIRINTDKCEAVVDFLETASGDLKKSIMNILADSYEKRVSGTIAHLHERTS